MSYVWEIKSTIRVVIIYRTFSLYGVKLNYYLKWKPSMYVHCTIFITRPIYLTVLQVKVNIMLFTSLILRLDNIQNFWPITLTHWVTRQLAPVAFGQGTIIPNCGISNRTDWYTIRWFYLCSITGMSTEEMISLQNERLSSWSITCLLR